MPSTDVSSRPPERAAIVGAGISGLTCATSLSLSIPQVQVFERALHAGGRSASHRAGGFEFDSGAQYFTVRDELFVATVEGWLGERRVAPWEGWLVELDGGNFMSRQDEGRYVGVPNMSALAAHMAGLCDVEYGCNISRIETTEAGLDLIDNLGESRGVFDLVILAAPPPQVQALVAPVSPSLAGRIDGFAMTRCWSLMLGFEQPLPVPFDAAYVVNSPLSWVARNSSKPGRAQREAWVAQASPEWSEANAERGADEVTAELLQAFSSALGTQVGRPAAKSAKLWRHAAPINALDQPFLYDREAGIGLCGDWCVAPRIEGAFLSGLDLAQAILDEI